MENGKWNLPQSSSGLGLGGFLRNTHCDVYGRMCVCINIVISCFLASIGVFLQMANLDGSENGCQSQTPQSSHY